MLECKELSGLSELGLSLEKGCDSAKLDASEGLWKQPSLRGAGLEKVILGNFVPSSVLTCLREPLLKTGLTRVLLCIHCQSIIFWMGVICVPHMASGTDKPFSWWAVSIIRWLPWNFRAKFCPQLHEQHSQSMGNLCTQGQNNAHRDFLWTVANLYSDTQHRWQRLDPAVVFVSNWVIVVTTWPALVI